MSVVKQWLRNNPEVENNIKDIDGLVRQLSMRYKERFGTLIDNNNVEVNIGDAIRIHGRPYMKVLGQGRYIAKYADTRTDSQKREQKEELKRMLSTWLDKRGYQFKDEAPRRDWIEIMGTHMLWEKNDDAGFNLVAHHNGIKVKSFKVEDVYQQTLAPYIDRDKTYLATLRQNSKIRREAMELSGMSNDELQDPQKKEKLKQLEDALSKEFYAQPTQKKMPNVTVFELENDIKKRLAWEAALPVDSSQYTLHEQNTLSAAVKNTLASAEQKAFDVFQEHVSSKRSPRFYDESWEMHSGLQYEDN